MLCPCNSGKTFTSCHGVQRQPPPLSVIQMTMNDGRVYKIVGVNEHVVRTEARKTELWREQGG
jgi:hypothetical protein